MSLPIVDTPLPDPLVLPEPREGTWNPDLSAALFPAPGSDAIRRRLESGNALVVTTGQQPGLFTGPAYAVTKALSARALAGLLERRWNRPVVTVYWVPGDDHDLHEVASAHWLNAEGDLVTGSLPARPPEAPMTPMWRERLGPGVVPLLEGFSASFPATESRDQTRAWLERNYRPEATVAGAYGAAMAELLAPFGIVCLDSAHAAVKTAGAGVLLRALDAPRELGRLLSARSAELAAAGRDPGVPVREEETLVFLDGEVGRDRLVSQDGDVFTRRGKSRYRRDELERIAREEPTRLSANVLLRPLLESAVLPTVAYVAGPGELRYLALAEALYQRLGVPRQLPVPRWSGLLVEPRVTRVIEKFRASVAELAGPEGPLETRIARQAMPEGTEALFAALRGAIDQGYAPVIQAAARVDPTLERPADSARAQALHAVENLEKKLLQHARKRESVELAQVAKARLSLRPEGKPQERVLSMAGFLARYGPDLLRTLAEHIEGWYAGALVAGPRTP